MLSCKMNSELQKHMLQVCVKILQIIMGKLNLFAMCINH
jgi:hypothetical protein